MPAYPLYGRVVLAPPQALGAALGPSNGRLRRRRRSRDPRSAWRKARRHDQDRRSGAAIARHDRARARRRRERADPRPAGHDRGGCAAGNRTDPAGRAGHLRLPVATCRPGRDAVAWASAARAAFPQAGWQIRSFREAARPLQGLLDQIAQFLSLVGLTALLVGGVGIGNAIRGHIAARTATIATLKCLGASTRLVFAVYLIEVMALALLGIGGALGLGALFPIAAATAACRRAAGLRSARPLSHAAGFGGALWPVDDAALLRCGRSPGLAGSRLAHCSETSSTGRVVAFRRWC